VQSVIDAGLIPQVIHLLAKGDLATRREAAWCINNLSLSGKREQVAYVLQQGVLVPFIQLLNTDDPQILVVVLDGINNILKMASSNESDLLALTAQIEECSGLDKIEELQNHRNEEIYKLAYDIIDHYFSEEDAEDLPANLSENQSQYTFDVPVIDLFNPSAPTNAASTGSTGVGGINTHPTNPTGNDPNSASSNAGPKFEF